MRRQTRIIGLLAVFAERASRAHRVLIALTTCARSPNSHGLGVAGGFGKVYDFRQEGRFSGESVSRFA